MSNHRGKGPSFIMGCLPLIVALAVCAATIGVFGWADSAPENEAAMYAALRRVYLSGPAGALFYLGVGYILFQMFFPTRKR